MHRPTNPCSTRVLFSVSPTEIRKLQPLVSGAEGVVDDIASTWQRRMIHDFSRVEAEPNGTEKAPALMCALYSPWEVEVV